MDRSTIDYLSVRWHQIANPMSLDMLGRALDFADLQPGDRAADLGCGTGFVSAWMAERHGLDLVGVERAPQAAELARQTAARPRQRGRLEIVEATAHDYLAAAAPHRLLCLLGPSEVIPGLETPAETMAALVPHIARGGWLLWGDPFWKRPPGPLIRAVYSEARYATLQGWVAAGEAAGLSPRHVAVSPDAEWETYVWTMNTSLEDWAERAPPAEAAAVRQRAAGVRRLYLEEAREGVGFGLFLFKRSA